MNDSEFYSNKDDIASATWPDPVGYYPHASVPQDHPDLVSAPGRPSTARSYVPKLNAAEDAELVMFDDVLTLVDCIIQVSNLCVVSSTLTYPAAPQNVLDPRLSVKPAACMFLSRIRYDPSYSPNGIEACSDVSSAVAQLQPVDDPYWTGVAPLPAHSVAATPEVSVNSTY